jgi:hypothetical protein
MRLPIAMVHDQALSLDFFRFIKPNDNMTANDANFASSVKFQDAMGFLYNYGVYQPGYLAEYVRRFIAFAWKEVAPKNALPSHHCHHSKFHENNQPLTKDHHETDVCPRPALRGTASAEPNPRFQCEYCSICKHHSFPWAIPQLQQASCSGDPTLKDLANLHGCHIVITTTVLGECYYLSDISHPNMPAFFATCLSMDMPLLFVPIAWRNHYWLDGGVTDNLPLGYVREKFMPTDCRHRIICFGFKTAPNPIYASTVTPLQSSDNKSNSAAPFSVRVLDQTNTNTEWGSVKHRQFTPVASTPPVDAQETIMMQQMLRNIRKSKESTCIHIVINTLFGMSKYRGADWIQQNYGIKIQGLILLDTPGIDSTTLVTSPGQKQECVNNAYKTTMEELKSAENSVRWQ